MLYHWQMLAQTAESYDECARRELEEELGVQIPLQSEGLFFTQGQGFRIWGKVYSCFYNAQQHGPLSLQPLEVADVIELSIQEILENPRKLPFTPDTLDALTHYVNHTLEIADNDAN